MENESQPTTNPPQAGAEPRFEDQLSELQGIVRTLEQGDLELDLALEAFEKGVQLTRQCENELKKAEQRVSQLVAQSDGTVREEPFPSEF